MKFFNKICLFFVFFTLVQSSFAADHLDGDLASGDPAADITDVYAWMQNSEKINLILNVFPLANESSKFSDSVKYNFLVNSQASYGADSNSNSNTLECSFSIEQQVSCKLNGDTIVENVDASSPEGVVSSDGSFKIFTGLRNDSFFFDLTNFNAVRTTVRDAASSLNFDAAGCPTLDTETKDVLVSSLVGAGGLPETNSPAVDFFSELNVLSIVVQADKNLFGSGPLYSVSASTGRG